MCIRSASIVVIGSVIGVPNRRIIPSVRPVIDQAKSKGRSGKIVMKRMVYILPVIKVHIAIESTKKASVVIIYIQATYTS